MPVRIDPRRALQAAASKGKLPPVVRFARADSVPELVAERTYRFVFSDETVDRYGDVIKASGWDLTNFENNPIALFGHDDSSVENVIGRAKNVHVRGTQLVGDIEFATADINPNAETVFRLVAGGFLKTVSVGFQPIAYAVSKDKARAGGIDFTRQDLMEISIVPVPANPNALAEAKAAGIEVDRVARLIRSVREPRSLIKAEKDMWLVSWLAGIVGDLAHVQDWSEWEEEREEDDSTVPADLLASLKTLGQILVDMTIEEVGELINGEDADDVMDDDIYFMSASDAEQRAAILRKLAKADMRELTAADTLLGHHRSGRRILIKLEEGAAFTPLIKAGRTISAKNEKCLRDAHDCLTMAAGHITSVLEPDAEDETDDTSGDAEAEEKAMRERRARALQRRLALSTSAP
jgi:HK97 family phage prohead protease